MSTNEMPIDDQAPEEVPTVAEETSAVPTPDVEEAPTMQQADPEGAADLAEKSYLADQYGEQSGEEPADDVVSQSAAAARQERERLMPEYLEHYFMEDLPPIDPNDPWNQGIYMRYRINQWRYVNGMDPVE